MAGEAKELKIKYTGDSTSIVEANRKMIASAGEVGEAEKKLKAAVSDTSKELQKAAETTSARGSAAKIEALVSKERERIEIARLVAAGQNDIAAQLERQQKAAREIKAAEVRGGTGLADVVRERQALEEIVATRAAASDAEARQQKESVARAEAAARAKLAIAKAQAEQEAALLSRAHAVVGGDVSAVMRDRQEAEERNIALHQRASRVVDEDVRAVTRKKGANEGLLESEKRVERQLSAMITDWSMTGSALDALAISADRLGDTFKMSLGVGVGIAVGIALKGAIESAAAEMNKLSESAANVFKQRENGPAKDMAEIAAQSKEAAAAAERYEKEIDRLNSGWERFKGNFFSGPLMAGDMVKGKQMELQKMADALRATETRRIGEMADKEGQRADIAKMIADGYGEQADALARQVKYAEEIGKLDADRERHVIQAIQRRQQAEESQRALANEQAALQRHAAYSSLAGQMGGEDSGVASARAELELINRQIELEKDSSSQKSLDLQQRKQEAEWSLKTAEDANKFRKEDAQLAREVAALTGSADERHLQTLSKELDVLYKRRDDLTDRSAKEAVSVDIAQKQMEQARLSEQMSINAQRMKMSAASGKQGFGASEELNVLRRQVEAEREIVRIKENSIDLDKEDLLSEYNKLAAMDRNLALKNAEHEVLIAEEVAQRNILNIEGSNQSEAAKRYKITQAQLAAVRAEIKAMGDLNSELATAARLREQGLNNDLKKQDQDLNFGKSEKDIRQRLRDEAKQQRELEQFEKKRAENKGLINPSKDISGEVTGGTNPITGEKETRPKSDPFDQLKPKAKEQGPQLKPGQDPAADEAFRDKFKSARERQEERKAKDEAGRGAAKDDNKGGRETPEVAELKAINKKIDKLIMT